MFWTPDRILVRKRRMRRSSVSAIRRVRWVHPTSSRLWVSRVCLLHPLPVCAVVVNPPVEDRSLHGNGQSSGGLLHGHRRWSTGFQGAQGWRLADGFTAPMQSIVEPLESGKRWTGLIKRSMYDWKVNSGCPKIGWLISFKCMYIYICIHIYVYIYICVRVCTCCKVEISRKKSWGVIYYLSFTHPR